MLVATRRKSWKTHSFVTQFLLPCLSDIVLGYVLPIHIESDYEIGASGFCELVPQIVDVNAAMIGACGVGDVDFVRQMISRGANDWSGGITTACEWQQIAAGEIIKKASDNICFCRRHMFICKTFDVGMLQYNVRLTIHALNYGTAVLRYSD